MYYLKWTERDIENLSASTGLKVLLTEVDAEGRVVREIGLNERQKLVHQSPTPSNPYGLFDNQVIETTNLRNDLTKEEFESLWIVCRVGSAHQNSSTKRWTVLTLQELLNRLKNLV